VRADWAADPTPVGTVISPELEVVTDDGGAIGDIREVCHRAESTELDNKLNVEEAAQRVHH
jgi:TusA-related sulfurtransferase